MVIIDKNGEVGEYGDYEFSISLKKVFSAICQAIPSTKGMRLVKVDKQAGKVLVHARAAIYSTGENIEIQVKEIAENRTNVRITSWPQMGTTVAYIHDFGKNQKNIESILSSISKILQKND